MRIAMTVFLLALLLPSSVGAVFALDDGVQAEYVPVYDLDIEDVQSPMAVGASQVLVVTIIPANATEQTVTYESMTPDVASVNALGRVSALSPGAAIIKVSAGGKISFVPLAVNAQETETSPLATAIDVDYERNMTIGETQMLSPLVLPAAATSEVRYSSSNPNVLSVNEFGRVSAVSAGSATITLSADDARKLITVTVTEEIRVAEIDLGDVQTEMTVGTSQTLSVSVFPPDAAGQAVEYTSSNAKVLAVNAFGRVSAVGIGSASITVSADAASKTVTIRVKAEIAPVDIDFDVTETKINVGSSVVIGATVLPADAVDQKISYTSSDTSVLTVNELGRVQGVSPGAATVTLLAGGIRKSIVYTVVKEDVVTTIEIGDYSEKMKVEGTQSISLTLYPPTAKDQSARYYSSDPKVASVSDSGKITAVAKGTATITVSAGEATKELKVTVYVETKKIEVPDNYLIMQPSGRYRVFASVFPADADQILTYRSSNETVARVGTDGTVTAVSPGRASIIMSNFDSMKTVTVIVNAGDVSPAAGEAGGQAGEQVQGAGKALAQLIRDAGDGESIAVSSAQCPMITTDMLLALYQTSKSISVFSSDYVVRIYGIYVKNAGNELATSITLSKTKAGMSFVVNGKNNLPGAIEIEFMELEPGYQYFYLFNENAKKYERLNSFDGTKAEISIAGEYVLSTSKLDAAPVGRYAAIFAGMLVLIGAGVYVVIGKKYWFW